MVFTQILVVLILIFAGYYVLMIGKEIIRKVTNETDYSKYCEDTEIDITEDLMNFDVTEINPSDIKVDDSISPVTEISMKMEEGSIEKDKSETPILPLPIDVVSLHNIIMNYKSEGPNPELDSFIYQVSEVSYVV